MKKIIIFTLFLLIIINVVSGCQYKETIQETHTKTEYYIEGNLLEFSKPFVEVNRFKTYKESIGTIYTYHFYLSNLIDKELTIKLSYSVAGENKEQDISIDAYSSKKITGKYDQSLPGLNHDSVRWELSNVEEKDVVSKVDNEICQICHNNKECLDDGKSCSFNNECGSNICNIAGVCGPVGSPFVVDCPNGLKNCADKSCLTPSIKEVGEAYQCKWECKSGVGKEGICKRPMIEWAIILGVLIIIISFIVWYIPYYKMKKLLEEIKKLRKEKETLQTRVISLGEEIDDINQDIKIGSKKIKELKNKIKNAKGKAKEEFENKLRIIKRKQEERLKKLEDKEEELDNKEEELDNKEEEFIIKSTKFKIKKVLDKLKQRYPNIYYHEKTGYIKFNDGTPLHKYLYRNNFGLKNGYHIHHIDADKLNNELWNLIELSPADHFNKLKHGRIEFQSWESGIKQLKEQLDYGTKGKPFPEHIQKEIDKRNIQKNAKK